MWSEEMDKKIRAASENNVHLYQEKNWKDMEILLEKHLPEQKRRRRIIFLILIPVLAVSGILLTRRFSADKQPIEQTISQQKDSNGPSSGSGENSRPANTAGNNKSTEKIIATATPRSAEVKTNESLTTDRPPFNNKNANMIAVSLSPKAGILKKRQSRVSDRHATTNTEKQTVSATNKPDTVKNIPSATEADQSPSALIVPGNQQQSSVEITVADSSASTVAAIKSEPADSSAIAANDPVKKDKPAKKKDNKLSFNFSAGPDLSSVRFAHRGEFAMQYGIGIGYAVSERINIRTGLYAGHKIYTADSTDYHLYSSNPPYKPYDINANCFVYEIPVSVMYSFTQTKNHNWFVSAGLSSYIMKKEDYDYNYKNPWGQTFTYQHNYRNENKHFFSVIGISGGYQYHFNKRFSILAEPYIKMPLTGIGAGKVKLNSTGVLFTASLKPFAK